MNKEIQLSVIIPAYREEDNLETVLPRLKSALNELGEEYEALVVGPIDILDGSENVCNEIGVTFLKRKGGNSYGDAIRTGIKYAKGRYVIFMDADGSHTPGFVGNLYRHRKDYDVVMASRYIKGGGSDNAGILIFMSFVVNALYSIFLGLNCKDISNSFKLYKKSDIGNLKLVSNNFDIVEEILYKLKRSKPSLKVLEVPYFFKERMFGRSKRNLFVFALSYIFTLTRLRLMK